MTTANPFAPAVKRALKARVAFAGPTGSGKTYTALTWATKLGKRIAFVDTERGSARLYADEFVFDVVEIEPPYHPDRIVDLLKAVERNGYDVCIIDSLSHMWEGEGGVLDIVEAAGARSGNTGNNFAGWKTGTPVLRHLIDTMLGLDAHLIVTMRSKMEYALQDGKNGRKEVVKLGMAPVMRNGVEYEFTAILDLDLDHKATVSKSRCKALADQVVQPGRAGEAAETFLSWLDGGEHTITKEQADGLVSAFDRILDEGARRKAKRAFVDAFGAPANIGESAYDDAVRAVGQLLDEAGVDAVDRAEAKAESEALFITDAEVVEG